MKPLTDEEIMKLASGSSKFKNLLLKVAQNESTEFNEAPPINEEEEDGEDNGDKPPKKKEDQKSDANQAPGEKVPPQAPQMAPATAGTPEEAGARAAQMFIGPDIMAAAASGNPGAAEIVARTAGAIAAAVTEKASMAMGGGETAMAEGDVPVEGEIPGAGAPAGVAAVPAAPGDAPVPTTPEGSVADSIIPPQNTPAAKPAQPTAEGAPPAGDSKAVNTNVSPEPAGQPVPTGTPAGNETYDAQTVAKMIQLAKAGKI